MAGVSYNEFGKLNMKQIRYISNAYSEMQKAEFEKSDVAAFIQGRYMVDALLCTVGNMCGGKYEYPEQAYSMSSQPLSEEEIQRQRDLFVASLQTMERNFKLSREEDTKGQGE